MSAASTVIDTLRARVSERDSVYERVEALAMLGPGDGQYDAFLAKHANAPDPSQAVRKEVDVKVVPPLLPSSPLPSSSLSDAPPLVPQIDELNARAESIDDQIDTLRAQLMDQFDIDVDAMLKDWALEAAANMVALPASKRKADRALEAIARKHPSLPPPPPSPTTKEEEEEDETIDVHILEGDVQGVDKGVRFTADQDNNGDDDDEDKGEVVDSGAIRNLSARLAPELAAIAKPHQKEGIEFCLRNMMQDRGCVLAHSMGLGKTLTTLLLMEALKPAGVSLVLLLSPLSVRVSWKDELEKWQLDIDFYPVKDSASLGTVLGSWKKGGGILNLTYELFINVASRLPTSHLLVLDEAHKLGNKKTRGFEAVQAYPCTRRVALTGTPVSNHLSEYFTILLLVAPALLKEEGIADFDSFRRRFIRPILRGQTRDATPEQAKLMRQHIHVLRKKMDSVMQRKTAALLVHALPPKTEYVLRYRLSTPYRALYDACTDECFEAWQHLVTRFSVQDKVRLAMLLLDALRDQQVHAIVFSQRKMPLEQLFAARNDGFLYCGAVSEANRQKAIRSFQDGQYRNMYMTTQCGSLGLTLTRATAIILLDCSWNPSTDTQAVFRAYRYGQTSPVNVYRLVALDTIEDYCYRLQVSKATLAANLIEEREINRQYTRAELHHEAIALPIHMIDPLSITDPSLVTVLRTYISQSEPLMISSHDNAFHDDEDIMTDDEKRDAQNEVNRARNASDRLFCLSDEDEFFVKPLEAYYRILRTDPVGIVTSDSPLDGGIYPPYIPIVYSKVAPNLIILHLGPTNMQQIRIRYMNGTTPEAWSDPIDTNPLPQVTGPNISPKCCYHPFHLTRAMFDQRGGTHVVSARAVHLGNPTLYSDWSEPSAPFFIQPSS